MRARESFTVRTRAHGYPSIDIAPIVTATQSASDPSVELTGDETTSSIVNSARASTGRNGNTKCASEVGMRYDGALLRKGASRVTYGEVADSGELCCEIVMGMAAVGDDGCGSARGARRTTTSSGVGGRCDWALSAMKTVAAVTR